MASHHEESNPNSVAWPPRPVQPGPANLPSTYLLTHSTSPPEPLSVQRIVAHVPTSGPLCLQLPGLCALPPERPVLPPSLHLDPGSSLTSADRTSWTTSFQNSPSVILHPSPWTSLFFVALIVTRHYMSHCFLISEFSSSLLECSLHETRTPPSVLSLLGSLGRDRT